MAPRGGANAAAPISPRKASPTREHGKAQARHSKFYIAGVVMMYWVVSISMVFLNKLLVSGPNGMALFVTFFQCVVTCVICFVAGELGERARVGDRTTSRFAGFPRAEIDFRQSIKLMPLSLIFVGMICFNNLCLRFVNVSFYNVARSLTLAFNVVLTWAILGSRTSAPTMLCLFVVVIGFVVGSNGEVDFSLVGTVSGVVSSLFVALNGIYTKKLLPVVANDQWRLAFVNNLNASLLFLPLIFVFEREALAQASLTVFVSAAYWLSMGVAGFFGFAIGICTVMQIKATSPLTHNISGTAKASFQSILAFWLWGNQPTFGGCLGIVLVLGGSLLYTYVKVKESEKPAHPALPK